MRLALLFESCDPQLILQVWIPCLDAEAITRNQKESLEVDAAKVGIGKMHDNEPSGNSIANQIPAATIEMSQTTPACKSKGKAKPNPPPPATADTSQTIPAVNANGNAKPRPPVV